MQETAAQRVSNRVGADCLPRMFIPGKQKFSGNFCDYPAKYKSDNKFHFGSLLVWQAAAPVGLDLHYYKTYVK
jgi:hypothetical protein